MLPAEARLAAGSRCLACQVEIPNSRLMYVSARPSMLSYSRSRHNDHGLRAYVIRQVWLAKACNISPHPARDLATQPAKHLPACLVAHKRQLNSDCKGINVRCSSRPIPAHHTAQLGHAYPIRQFYVVV